MDAFSSQASQILDNIIVWSYGMTNTLSHLSFETIIKAVVIYVCVMWIAFIIWVVKDITTRTSSVLFQVFCILIMIVLTPVFGWPIYVLIRPRTTLFEEYYGSEGYAEASDESRAMMTCQKCNARIEKDFFFCPHCRTELLHPCPGCDRIVSTRWKICAYCGYEDVKVATKGDKKKASPSPKKPNPVVEPVIVSKDPLSVEEIAETPSSDLPTASSAEALSSSDTPASAGQITIEEHPVEVQTASGTAGKPQE